MCSAQRPLPDWLHLWRFGKYRLRVAIKIGGILIGLWYSLAQSQFAQPRQQHPPLHVLGLTLHQLGKHLAGAGKLTALHTLSGSF